jgi:hypothetical protein
MSEPKHILVLGAGASCHMEFPTGNQLVHHICNNPTLVVPDETADTKYAWEDLKSFAYKLKGSGTYSIDEFLEKNPNLRDIGKVQIAAHLCKLEREAVMEMKCQSGWHTWFSNRVMQQTATPAKLPIRCVSFNYDNTFEWSLVLTLVHKHSLSIQEARKRVEEFNVVHIYGRLPTWQKWSGVDSRHAVQIDTSYSTLIDAKESIFVMNEERENVIQAANQAKRWIENSNSVTFLGFGFDETNCARIGVWNKGSWRSNGTLTRDRAILSAYGALDSERERILREVLGVSTRDMMLEPQNVYVGEIKEDCETVLRKFVDPQFDGWCATPSSL